MVGGAPNEGCPGLLWKSESDFVQELVNENWWILGREWAAWLKPASLCGCKPKLFVVERWLILFFPLRVPDFRRSFLPDFVCFPGLINSKKVC